MTSVGQLDHMNGVRINLASAGAVGLLIVSHYTCVGSANPSLIDARLEHFTFLIDLGSKISQGVDLRHNLPMDQGSGHKTARRS